MSFIKTGLGQSLGIVKLPETVVKEEPKQTTEVKPEEKVK